MRYYINNFLDGPRQDGVDLLLGRYVPSLNAPTPFEPRPGQETILSFVMKLFVLAVAVFRSVAHTPRIHQSIAAAAAAAAAAFSTSHLPPRLAHNTGLHFGPEQHQFTASPPHDLATSQRTAASRAGRHLHDVLSLREHGGHVGGLGWAHARHGEEGGGHGEAHGSLPEAMRRATDDGSGLIRGGAGGVRERAPNPGDLRATAPRVWARRCRCGCARCVPKKMRPGRHGTGIHRVSSWRAQIPTPARRRRRKSRIRV